MHYDIEYDNPIVYKNHNVHPQDGNGEIHIKLKNNLNIT